MLMFNSAPAAACSESAPNGLQMSSQIEIPTFTPPITYSSSGSDSSPGREVARLVEHGVVRQQPLAIRADDLAVRADRGGVVDVAVLVDEADDRRAAAGPRGELRQHLEVVGDEARLEHEILGRIAGGRQLGEGHDVAPGGIGTVVGVGHQREVAVEVAHGRVELGERDPQHRHVTRLPNRPPRPVCDLGPVRGP